MERVNLSVSTPMRELMDRLADAYDIPLRDAVVHGLLLLEAVTKARYAGQRVVTVDSADMIAQELVVLLPVVDLTKADTQKGA